MEQNKKVLIGRLTVGEYQTNCYIVRAEGCRQCCVIDPGYEPELILQQAEKAGLEIEAVLLTHGHFDHVGGVKILAAETGCRVYIHPDDLSLPPMLTAGPIYHTDTYTDGDSITAGGLSFRVLSTPGHTRGSVCLITGDVMFSGDTLFQGSCGRTDLPGGSYTDISASLARLAALEDDYRVYPGHMGPTTLAYEKQSNPYMQ